jgi:outer membrane protein assembly factor BamA
LIVFGQKEVKLVFSNDSVKIIDKQPELRHRDSISTLIYLKKIRLDAIKKGYLVASIDTIKWTKDICSVHFYLGQKIKFAFIQTANSDKLSVRLSPLELASFLEKKENFYLNSGYPFARVKLVGTRFQHDTLAAQLDIQQGKKYTISKIHVKGDSSVSEIFLSSLTGIRVKDVFQEDKFRGITTKISQVSFLKELKPHELLFTEEGCEVFFYVSSNPVSSANGTVGLQPNAAGKVGLAGELNLKLLNILKRGEQLNLAWRSIQDQTQSMNLRGNYPFLFKSAFGVDGQLQLYKKDSSFLEVRSTIGVQYLLNSGATLKAFYQQNSNNLLRGASTNPNFSNLSNVRTNSYGLSWVKRQLDYIPNPAKGYVFLFEGAIGTRKSRVTDSSATERSETYRLCVQTEWFMPVARRHIVRFASLNEFYYAPVIYQNELFRFGGQLSLRGFNEDELYASSRSVTTIEYRFLLDRNSNLFAFYDQGYYENNASKYLRDQPFGFGAGFSFGTNLGIFSLSYALGKQQNNPIQLSNGKIHFGYIAYF